MPKFKKFFFKLAIILLVIFNAQSVLAVDLTNSISNFGIYKDIVYESNQNLVIRPTPSMAHNLVMDLNLDNNFQSTNKNSKFKESLFNARYFNKIHLNDKFSVNSYFRLIDEENQRNPWQFSQYSGKNRYFRDLRLELHEVNLRYNYYNKEKKFNNNLLLGKFDLGFGTAWRWDRGLFVHKLAENYKQTKKLGFSDILKIGNAKKTGEYNLGLSLFSDISSAFSEANSTGNAGETRALKSINFVTDINFDFAKDEKLSYHFSYLKLAVDSNKSLVRPSKIADQKGFIYGIRYQYPFLEKIIIDGLMEYTKINNFQGDSDRLQSYLNTNILLKYNKSWSLLLGNVRHKNRNVNAVGFNQIHSEISCGYEFTDNKYFDKLTMQIGYHHNRISYLNKEVATTGSYGFLLRYFKNF